MIIRLLAMLLAGLVFGVTPAWAGPVEWVEVPATEAGQQWWDSGSVRENRQGLRQAEPGSGLDVEPSAGGKVPEFC